MRFFSSKVVPLLALALIVAFLGAIFGAATHVVTSDGGSLTQILGMVAIGAGLPAIDFPTIMDVTKIDKGSGHDVIVEAIHSHAEVNLFPAVVQSETKLDVTVLTGLPTGDSFRRPNAGVKPSKAAFETKSYDMALVERRVEVDVNGVYARAKDKARLLVTQSVPQMQKALSDISKQIIYGKLNDSNKGFPGLIAQYAADAQHEVNVGAGANKSSVWFLEILPTSMELVFGADASLTMGDDWKETDVTLGDNERLTVLANKIFGWTGFRLLNKHRAIRVKNIGTANGATLTADHMNAAMNLCEDEYGFRPTHILGNGRSFEQLRASLATDLNKTPKRLLNWDGVPLVRSINISKDEA